MPCSHPYRMSSSDFFAQMENDSNEYSNSCTDADDERLSTDEIDEGTRHSFPNDSIDWTSFDRGQPEAQRVDMYPSLSTSFYDNILENNQEHHARLHREMNAPLVRQESAPCADPVTKGRSRSFCGTWNNYTDEMQGTLRSHVDLTNATYLIYGREVAPDTGTPHLQFYVRYKCQVAFSTVRGYFPGAHIEIALGTPEQNMVGTICI